MDNIKNLLTNDIILNYSDVQISLTNFTVNLILAFILSILLKIIYDRYATTISNRKILSKNFILLTVTTMLVITIVKSSLALSLGLVGALSIVRFRAAIKEPEELTYLFLCIAVGLGLGANQTLITILGFIFIIFFIIVSKKFYKIFYKDEDFNNLDMLNLSIRTEKNSNLKISIILDSLKDSCELIDFKKLIENHDSNEFMFLVKFNDINEIDNIKNKILDIDRKAFIEIIDINNLI